MAHQLTEKIIEPQEHVPMYQFDRDTGFWGIPNVERKIPVWGRPGAFITARHNEEGNRDDPYAADAAERCILCFGASHTWGEGVEQSDRYTDVLSRKTNTRFVNLGHCSFGLDQVCIAMMKRAGRYSPSTIIIEQYPRVIHRVLLTCSSGYLKPYFYLDPQGGLKLKKVPRYAGFKTYRDVAGAFRWYRKELQDFMGGIDRTAGYDPMLDPIFLYWKSHHYEQMDLLIDKILVLMKQICVQAGCNLLFVLFTVHQQFLAKHETDLVDYELPAKRFKKLLEKNDINYLDTASAVLKAHSKDDPLIQPDGHTNAKGHGIVADLIRSELENRHWLTS